MERRHLAAASGHLHLAAAEYYMAKAAGSVQRPTEDPSDSDDAASTVDASDDAAPPISGHAGGGGDVVSIDVGCNDDDDISIDVDCNDDASGGGSSGDDDGEELHWTMQELFELLLLLASFVPPAPVYKALPRDVVEGLSWTWIVLAYGILIAMGVTIFSVRVFGTSKRCLPMLLRVLLLVATVVTEVSMAVYIMPSTTLTVVGTCFTVLLLLITHLVACRRRRLRSQCSTHHHAPTTTE